MRQAYIQPQVEITAAQLTTMLCKSGSNVSNEKKNYVTADAPQRVGRVYY